MLVESLAGLQSEAAQLALATAQKSGVRVALLQDARQVYDVQEELSDAGHEGGRKRQAWARAAFCTFSIC